MSFAATRRLLFQVHMWIGLILGLLLALLGLSGSILVYDDAIANLLSPPPRATMKGEALSLDKIAEAARGVAGRGPMQIMLPRAEGEAIVVRVGQISPMGPIPAQREARNGGRVSQLGVAVSLMSVGVISSVVLVIGAAMITAQYFRG